MAKSKGRAENQGRGGGKAVLLPSFLSLSLEKKNISLSAGEEKYFPYYLPDFLLHLIGQNWVSWPSFSHSLAKGNGLTVV